MPKEKDPNKKKRPAVMDPTKLPVTKRRAQYLAEISGLDVERIVDQPIGKVNELLQWRVDPQLLLFRRICGRVVKRDPVTGALCPVPGATVTVYDTDCSFLGFFPLEPPFFYLYPITCSREEMATVTTDACGRFCVNLPYWDIDRLLRLRLKRICFPDIYKLRLRDIIELLPDPPIIRVPRPQPDPPPFDLINPEVIELARNHIGPEFAERLEVLSEDREFGASLADNADLLETPLPTAPPPLPTRLREQHGANLADAAMAAGLEDKLVQQIDFDRYLGPFIRCKDVIVAEWVPFIDVPDITFGVTQDVDDDGVEEVIYSESFFDVRWNAATPLYVTLEANASALCVPVCEPVPEIPCEDTPVISTVGYMTLNTTHHDDSDGYGTRVNRPAPPVGNYSDRPPTGGGAATANSPYARSLNLHGCHRIDDATHYRLTYVLNGVGGPVPFTGISWYAPRSAASPGPPIHVVPDADGWYPILNAAIVEHPSWLLHWPTQSGDNGTYEVRLQVGTPSGGGMNVIATSDPRTFTVDNDKPNLSFLEVRWRYANVIGPWTNANSTLLPAVCPVITRNPAHAIRVRAVWQASSTHLRNAQISFTGCGGPNPTLVQPTPAMPDIEAYRHWHINQFDNSVLQPNEFEIPAGADPGCYTLHLHAASRAFNPSGFDYGPTYDWLINQTSRWSNLHRAISVVNA